jgi:DNA-binding CsgD family transcriptional regulator
MTRIILILNARDRATFISEDPRPPRELMMAINLGKYVVGANKMQMGRKKQRAEIIPNMGVVIAFMEAPLVKLTPRQYQVLLGLSDGKTAGEIAADLGISRRMVYGYNSELKERFGLQTVKEVLHRAWEYGLVEWEKPKKKRPAKGRQA